MHRFFLSLFCFISIAPHVQGQLLRNFHFTEHERFREFVDKAQDFCTFPEGTWLNSDMNYPAGSMQGKLSIVQYGSFDNVFFQYNAEMLTRIQEAFGEITVILVNNPKFSFPKDSLHVDLYLKALDLSPPMYLDSEYQSWECNRIDTWPTTLLVSPQGKVIDRITGPLSYREMELGLPRIITMLKRMGGYNDSPSLSKRPSLNRKIPMMRYPIAIERNREAGLLFVSDFVGNRIWVLNSLGDVVNVIGNGEAGDEDGDFSSASFDGPWGLAWDGVSKHLYVADHRNHTIRRVDFNNATVSRIWGNGNVGERGRIKGTGKQAAMGYPTQLLLDGPKLLISLATAEIWSGDTRTEVAERLVGTGHIGFEDGPAIEAKIGQVLGMAKDPSGPVFFSDAQSSSIRSLENRQVKSILGKGLFDYGYEDGRGDKIAFQAPMGMVVVDEELYIADAFNHNIRKLDAFKVKSATVAGSNEPGHRDGRARSAQLLAPSDLTVLDRKLFITDPATNSIRVLDMNENELSSLSLIGYEELARGMMPAIHSIVETSGIEVRRGNNDIRLELLLAEGYELDPAGFSNFDVSSRNDSIFVRKQDLIEGKIQLDYQLEPDDRHSDLLIDFHLYLRRKEGAFGQYYYGLSFLIPVSYNDEAPEIQRVTMEIDPDLDATPAQTEGGDFME